MPEIHLVRKGLLPIAKMGVEVAGQYYEIAGLKSREIVVPEGELVVKLRLEGWYGTFRVQVDERTQRLVIKPFIRDVYYVLCLVTCIAFFYLDAACLAAKIILGTAGGLMMLSIIFFTFFRDQKYFSCAVE